jgi:hypothetical protein
MAVETAVGVGDGLSRTEAAAVSVRTALSGGQYRQVFARILGLQLRSWENNRTVEAIVTATNEESSKIDKRKWEGYESKH